MSGQSFEFTPAGIRPLDAAPIAAGEVIPAAQAIAALKAQVATQEAARPVGRSTHPAALEPTPHLTGKSLVKQIRARLADVRRELKRLRKLEAEEAELKRLLAAAKQPPARVTDIHQARRSG